MHVCDGSRMNTATQHRRTCLNHLPGERSEEPVVVEVSLRRNSEPSRPEHDGKPRSCKEICFGKTVRVILLLGPVAVDTGRTGGAGVLVAQAEVPLLPALLRRGLVLLEQIFLPCVHVPTVRRSVRVFANVSFTSCVCSHFQIHELSRQLSHDDWEQRRNALTELQDIVKNTGEAGSLAAAGVGAWTDRILTDLGARIAVVLKELRSAIMKEVGFHCTSHQVSWWW